MVVKGGEVGSTRMGMGVGEVESKSVVLDPVMWSGERRRRAAWAAWRVGVGGTKYPVEVWRSGDV